MQSAVADAASRDSDIADLLRAGHRDRAFEALLPRYEGKIYRLCCALLRDRTQAEDAAQESLIRIWRALDGYDGRASLSSWIYAITRNRCLTALEGQRLKVSVSDIDTDSAVAAVATTNEGSSNHPSEQLRELVDLLPGKLRRTLMLYYFEEHSTSEVALMLGCPQGTVKTHLFRAREALRAQLKMRGLDDPTLWLEPTS